jgi:hypothetical protein
MRPSKRVHPGPFSKTNEDKETITPKYVHTYLHKNPREVTTSKRTLSGYHQFLSEAATTEENTTVYLALPCDIHHHKRTRGTALLSCITKT